MPSRLDSMYRRMLITRFFDKGWGKPENLQRLFEFRKIISNREECYKLVPKDYPVEIIKTEKQSDCTLLEGKFKTPLEYHLPGLVPKAAQEAHFQILLPNKWSDEKHKPMCIHLAGTGDHYFWRRRNFIAKPLLKEAGIGAILLENPFYGTRKPENQVRSNLNNVSDIFVMGGCLVMESLVLLHWCEKNGYGPLGVTGLSMGGHMASLAATNWPKPLVLVPCLSWSTASAVFTQGVMSQSINWDMLETQYFSDGNYSERLSKMVTVVDDAFTAGQKFVTNFTQSMEELQSDIKESTATTDAAGEATEAKPAKPKTSKIIKLDKKNTLNLSGELHDKLMSEKRFELTQAEILELNTKIREVQDKIRDEQRKLETQIGKRPVSAPELLMTATADSGQALVPHAQQLQPAPEPSTLTKLMSYILPGSAQTPPSIDITKTNWWEREALQFMRGVMDECTHLKNFSVPYDTSLIIAVCAKDDAYVPRDGCSSLEEIWPGVEVRYLDAGHVSAYVLHQKLFRSSIIEAFERAKKKAESEDYALQQEALEPVFTYDQLRERYNQTLVKN